MLRLSEACSSGLFSPILWRDGVAWRAGWIRRDPCDLFNSSLTYLAMIGDDSLFLSVCCWLEDGDMEGKKVSLGDVGVQTFVVLR